MSKPAWPGPAVPLREDGFGPIVETIHVGPMRQGRLGDLDGEALFYADIDHPGGPAWLLVYEGRSPDDDPDQMVWWCPRTDKEPGGVTDGA